MAKVCSICGRGALSGNSRSHSNIATRRKQNINLQKTPYHGERVKACASCIRTLSKKGKV